jgi:uncharacterized membrane protein
MKIQQSETTTAWFGALCFFLSTIEYMVPKPLPFLRLGLANLPVMLSVDILPLPFFFILVLIKILGQGLIGGTIFSYLFLFSAAGSLCSAVLMLSLKKLFPRSISWIGISIAGAFASNVSQLFLARFYIFGPSAWYIAPPFLLVGVITGTLLGLFANTFSRKSRWYAEVASGEIRHLQVQNVKRISSTNQLTRFSSNPLFRFLTGILLLAVLLFSDNLLAQTFIVASGAVLLFLSGGRIRILQVSIMTASIILFNLMVPLGRVLWSPLYLPITQGALLSGIQKALTVEGMIFLSRWMLKDGLRLPGKLGQLVSQSFEILGHLTDSRKKLDPKNLIRSIDTIMYGRD